MSPTWLQTYATITGNYTLHSQYLELHPTTVLGILNFYQQALQVRLVAPGILKQTDCVGVTVTVAIDTVLGESTDHDPTFGVSDGTSFIGFTIPDVYDYGHRSPCEHREGEVTTVGLLQTKVLVEGPLVTSQNYSAEIKLQFRPTEQWGSCHTQHNAGYVYAVKYQERFDLTKGLYLQMYHEDDHETYCIKYIVADVHVD